MKPDTAMDQRRRAALTLHALHEDDRRWVLENLSGSHRSGIEALLAELVELGIPGDPSLLNGALAESGDTQLVPASGDPLSVDPTALAKLLEHEPDSIVRQCLGLLGEAQRREVIARMPSSRRAVASETQVTTAPALSAAIAQIVKRKLESSAGSET